MQLAFKIQDDHQEKPIGYQHIKFHMIFNIKFDFIRKVWFVTGDQLRKPPASLTNSSVIPRESLRIWFLVAVFNDLNILLADIGITYLNMPCHKKVCFTTGRELGPSKMGNLVI